MQHIKNSDKKIILEGSITLSQYFMSFFAKLENTYSNVDQAYQESSQE